MTRTGPPTRRTDISDPLTGAVLISSCAITPRWAGMISIADVVLVVVAVVAVLLALTRRLPGAGRGRPLWWILPPLWVWMLLELFSTLRASGDTAVLSTVKDVSSLCYLLVPIVVLGPRKASELPVTRYTAIAGIVILTAWVVIEGGTRPSGPFPDPTYTGSWLAIAAVLVGALRTRLVVLAPTLVIAAVGLVRVQSFAAVASLGVGYLMWWIVRRRQARLAFMAAGVAVGAALPFVGSVLVEWVTVQIAPAVRGSALAHLQYTSAIRWDIWLRAVQLATRHPLGIGPGQFSHGDYFLASAGLGYETHNTFLELMVELGWLGLAAYIWLVWRLTQRGRAAASAIMIAFVCESALHNTFNFRHMWVMAAIAVVLVDVTRTRHDPPIHTAGETAQPDSAIDEVDQTPARRRDHTLSALSRESGR